MKQVHEAVGPFMQTGDYDAAAAGLESWFDEAHRFAAAVEVSEAGGLGSLTQARLAVRAEGASPVPARRAVPVPGKGASREARVSIASRALAVLAEKAGMLPANDPRRRLKAAAAIIKDHKRIIERGRRAGREAMAEDMVRNAMHFLSDYLEARTFTPEVKALVFKDPRLREALAEESLNVLFRTSGSATEQNPAQEALTRIERLLPYHLIGASKAAVAKAGRWSAGSMVVCAAWWGIVAGAIHPLALFSLMPGLIEFADSIDVFIGFALIVAAFVSACVITMAAAMCLLIGTGLAFADLGPVVQEWRQAFRALNQAKAGYLEAYAEHRPPAEVKARLEGEYRAYAASLSSAEGALASDLADFDKTGEAAEALAPSPDQPFETGIVALLRHPNAGVRQRADELLRRMIRADARQAAGASVPVPEDFESLAEHALLLSSIVPHQGWKDLKAALLVEVAATLNAADIRDVEPVLSELALHLDARRGAII